MKNIRIGQKEVIHFIGIGKIIELAQVMKTMNFNLQGFIKVKIKIPITVQNCFSIKIFIGHAQKKY